MHQTSLVSFLSNLKNISDIGGCYTEYILPAVRIKHLYYGITLLLGNEFILLSHQHVA